MGRVFSSFTSISLFGRNPAGMGSLIRYIVNGSLPVLVMVNSRFAGMRIQMPLYRSAVLLPAFIVPFPERK